jgi:hypothetical protein
LRTIIALSIHIKLSRCYTLLNQRQQRNYVLQENLRISLRYC